MNKKDLKELEKLSPWAKEQWYQGWSSPMELHNGNVYVLVFWKGKLMKLEEAPKMLNKKYYDSHRGKTLKEYEWTLLKKMILSELNHLDRAYKRNTKE